MLPDYPQIKDKLKKKLNYAMRQALLSHLGPLADTPTLRFFEGNKAIIIREDGSVAEMNPKEMEVDQKIKIAELEGMNHRVVLDTINCLGKKMAEKQVDLTYEVIRKTAEEVGNVVSTDGEPLSIDSLLEMFEKIHIDFDEEGNPYELTPIASPEVYASIAKVISQAEADPETGRRFNEIMERKKKEWRARESNRKLVG